MISRKVYSIWLIQLIKVVIFCFYDFDLGGHFKGQLGKNVGFLAYSYIIIVNNLKTVMISRKIYCICLVQRTTHNLFCFCDFDLRGHFKGHLGKNVGFIVYFYIIIVNNLKTVMISIIFFKIWSIQLIKLNLFCLNDFDLRGHFKGHMVKDVGFIAYSYIAIVNKLKTAMILRKVFKIWLIQLIKLNLFYLNDFDLEGHFKGHLGKNVGFLAYNCTISMYNFKTVMILKKIYNKWFIQLIEIKKFSFITFNSEVILKVY